MFRKPRWSVTWPTRPDGVYTVLVRADNPTEAVRVAAEQDDLPVYALAFDYEPEVWRLLRPYRWRSHHVAGPDYGGGDFDVEAITPLDLNGIAKEVVSVIRGCDAHGKSKDEVRAAVGQIVGNLLPSLTERVLAIVAAETRETNAYTDGLT